MRPEKTGGVFEGPVLTRTGFVFSISFFYFSSFSLSDSCSAASPWSADKERYAGILSMSWSERRVL